MPHNGLPPEVVDEILSYLEDDKPALLSCMLASKAFRARAEPVMYRRLEIRYVCQSFTDVTADYKLDRATARLVRTLEATPGHAQQCPALTVSFHWDEWRIRTLSPTPLTRASLRALLKRFSAVTNFAVTSNPRGLHLLSRMVGLSDVLSTVPTGRGLHSLRLSGLNSDLLPWLLSLAHLTSLTFQQPILRKPLPTPPATFRLAHLGVGKLDADDADVFALLTANSLTSLTSLAAPYSFPFETSLVHFPHLTSLTLTFDSYSDDPSCWRSSRREALQHFLETNNTLRTLTFSHGTSSPGPRRTALLITLPPHLEVLRLRPYPLPSQTALGLIVDLPATLRKVEWTPWSGNGPWKSGRRESVEEACKAKGIQDVTFTTVEKIELDG
ncbi:hypothetical protein JCM10213_003613 [Rhodosporidiobolus nylandii]